MPDLLDQPPIGNLPELSVSELAGQVKRTLEQNFEHVRVRGELGRVTFHRNGHIYLDIKDDKASINSVIWRGQAGKLKIKPEEGLEVVAIGRITTFAARSTYQLVIEELELAGVGALMAMLERRRKALAAEGLFDEAKKEPLPYLPETIGVITSPTGAVIRDIMHRLRDRFPRHVILWPVTVQGERAAGEVAAAIEGFNRLPAEGTVRRPDVLIVARGGGSFEDLMPFNEEIVVRAAAASRIPLISAVGHETDTTLIDFASDRRAPTPTAAAEIAVPVRAQLIEQTLALEGRQLQAVRRLMAERRRDLEGLARGLPKPDDLLSEAQQRLDTLAHRLPQALRARASAAEARLARIAGRIRPGLLVSLIRTHGRRLMDLMARAQRAAARRPAEHRRSLDRLSERLSRAMTRHARQERQTLGQGRARLDGLSARLAAGQAMQLGRARQSLDAATRLLETLSFERTLERGYAVVSTAGGEIVKSGAEALRARDVELRFRGEDRVAARVVGPGRDEEEEKKPRPAQGRLL